MFISKNLLGKDTKDEEKRQKKGGGALVRAGAHIRDNTVHEKHVKLLRHSPRSPRKRQAKTANKTPQIINYPFVHLSSE